MKRFCEEFDDDFMGIKVSAGMLVSKDLVLVFICINVNNELVWGVGYGFHMLKFWS